jgi:cytochrome c oxidase subunit 2
MNWLKHPASVQAGALAEVGWVLIIGAGVIFLLTMALLALALRARKRVLPTAWWVIGGGIVLPVTVLSVLLGYSVLRTGELDRPSAGDPLIVNVTGHLWWWRVSYHDAASGRWIELANELRLPAGRPVQLGLNSADVIHSFWVPALGGKIDLVPGRTNRLVVTALREGVHRGVCAEFCGTQHARMALHVVVLPPADFERWLAAQAAPAPAATDATLERGRRAFVEHGCIGCHAVRGLGDDGLGRAAQGRVLGPDLTHVASRLTLGAGTLPNGRDAIAHWIADVQAFKPGARMPSFGHLDRATLDALAAYLAHLQ